MAEAVKVIVRCRPMNGREKALNCTTVVAMDSRLGQCSINNPNDKKSPPKSFTFDGAYNVDSTTENIYADIGYPLVEGVTEGYNGTIFAYGQTGCGKSFSMQGITDPATQRGIIPRAFDHIFETIQVMEGVKFLVHASYLEIYNEDVRDLLGKDVKQKLDLKEHPDRGVYVQGLSLHPCKNVVDCNAVMSKGWNNRATGATLMNADSSRSHSIFSIHLERSETDASDEEHIRAAKLNLVDLAGSERQGKTGATGDRLKEATKINLSLSALGNVISALVDGKSKHIPFRDSKLTRLLQDSLGGNTKTLMVACLSPADNNYDETLSTLRYANRAKNIKNKPKINEDPKDALLREYQEEIQKLKAMLRGDIPVALDSSAGGAAMAAASAPGKTKVVEKVVVDETAIEKEKDRLRLEYQEEISSIKHEFEEMKMSKQVLEQEMQRLQSKYENDVASVEEQAHHIPSPGQAGAAGAVIIAADGHLASSALAASEAPMAGSGAAQPMDKPIAVVTANSAPVPIPSSGAAAAADSRLAIAQEEGEEEEIEGRLKQRAQTAVHIGTVKEGLTAPSSSPTGEPGKQGNMASEALKREATGADALKRLQLLQEQMVGGEEAANEEVKERRRKKKKYADERKRALAEAIANMEDDGIMLQVYENTQDEIRAKNKLISKYKDKTESLQTEIADLQSEFEFDRIDYLDTIRKQDQQMKLLQSIIEKIHPCLRRDCNYANLDRIKSQCEWSEELQVWNLPKMSIEKTSLPPAGVMPGGRQAGPAKRSPRAMNNTMNGEVQPSIYDDLRYEDRFLERDSDGIHGTFVSHVNLRKLQNSEGQELANNYFRSTRADKLLQQKDSKSHMQTNSPLPAPAMNGSSNVAPAPWQNDPMSQDQLRAAQVHGQMSLNNDDQMYMAKPARLEAIPLASAQKPKKKKKKQINTMEQF